MRPLRPSRGLSMPHLLSETSDFAGSTAFAVIDFASGYWQLPVEEASQESQSIITPQGVYASSRTLQGSVNAAANFQGKVEPLYSCIRSHLKAWIDDFILHQRSFSELLPILRRFFEITRENGLFISAPKTLLYAKWVRWCGRKVDHEGIHLDPARSEVLAQMERPRTGGELCQTIRTCHELAIV